MTHAEIVVIPKQVPPPIPARKMAPDAHTGSKGDTVGPAFYNPKIDSQKPVAPQNNFVAS